MALGATPKFFLVPSATTVCLKFTKIVAPWQKTISKMKQQKGAQDWFSSVIKFNSPLPNTRGTSKNFFHQIFRQNNEKANIDNNRFSKLYNKVYYKEQISDASWTWYIYNKQLKGLMTSQNEVDQHGFRPLEELKCFLSKRYQCVRIPFPFSS